MHMPPEIVAFRLETAHKVYAALPGGWGGPRNKMTASIFGETASYEPKPDRPRLPIPDPREIDDADEAMSWLGLIADERHRMAVALRSIIHPWDDRHILSWRRIGEKIGCSHEGARQAYQAGITQICRALRSQQATRLAA